MFSNRIISSDYSSQGQLIQFLSTLNTNKINSLKCYTKSIYFRSKRRSSLRPLKFFKKLFYIMHLPLSIFILLLITPSNLHLLPPLPFLFLLHILNNNRPELPSRFLLFLLLYIITPRAWNFPTSTNKPLST